MKMNVFLFFLAISFSGVAQAARAHDWEQCEQALFNVRSAQHDAMKPLSAAICLKEKPTSLQPSFNLDLRCPAKVRMRSVPLSLNAKFLDFLKTDRPSIDQFSKLEVSEVLEMTRKRARKNIAEHCAKLTGKQAATPTPAKPVKKKLIQ